MMLALHDITNPELLPKVRSKQIMASAMGQNCALRVSSFYPGHKCAGRDTTVACHIQTIGKGTGTKVTDLAVAYGCSHCHAIVDGVDRKRAEYIATNYPTAFVQRLLDAMVETQARLVGEAIVFVVDGEIRA
jgi:hypothetical protein